MPIVVYRAMQPVGSLTVVGVEMFRKQVDTAAAGENVGLLLSATDRSAVQPGDQLTNR
jgi:translation elongation factor EF-Tu-like GTPase